MQCEQGVPVATGHTCNYVAISLSVGATRPHPQPVDLERCEYGLNAQRESSTNGAAIHVF